jgi:hypothetical protein
LIHWISTRPTKSSDRALFFDRHAEHLTELEDQAKHARIVALIDAELWPDIVPARPRGVYQ